MEQKKTTSELVRRGSTYYNHIAVFRFKGYAVEITGKWTKRTEINEVYYGLAHLTAPNESTALQDVL